MILVRLAMGTGASGPDSTVTPSCGNGHRRLPVAGHGSAGVAPATGDVAGSAPCSDTVGNGRPSCSP